jgi:hypothetical protein
VKVLVCGSRRFANPFAVSLHADRRMAELPDGSIVIHGDAHGADRIAAQAAARHGHTIRPFPADWENDGRRAGIVRNLRMLNERPELVIAWWDGESRGTAHTITEARKRGIPVEVHRA